MFKLGVLYTTLENRSLSEHIYISEITLSDVQNRVALYYIREA
jgi:hypothetical protein